MGRFMSKIKFKHTSETPGVSYGTQSIIGTKKNNNSQCFCESSLHIYDMKLRSEDFSFWFSLVLTHWRWDFFFPAVSKPFSLPFQSRSNRVLSLLSPSVPLWPPVGLPESLVIKCMIIKYRKMILTFLLPLAS